MYIIVGTEAESPVMYVATQPLDVVIHSLQKYYIHRMRFFIYEVAVIPNAENIPENTALLRKVANVEPKDWIEHHMWMLGHELDKVPPTQEVIMIDKIKDHLDRKRDTAVRKAEQEVLPIGEVSKT